jgi:hypothetical protein
MQPIKKHKAALAYALAAIGVGLGAAAHSQTPNGPSINSHSGQGAEASLSPNAAFTTVNLGGSGSNGAKTWEEQVQLIEETNEFSPDKAMELSMELANDKEIRALFSESFGKEGLEIADMQPNLYTMFASGEYDRETLEAALEAASITTTGEVSKSFAKNGCQDPNNSANCFGAVFRKNLHRYKPIYFFGSGFQCFPIRWSRAQTNYCAPGLPSNGKVPVYASVTWRKSDQGGGNFSFWINYHVFYGWQVGLPGQAFGAAGGSGRHGNDWEMTSVHIVNDRPAAVRYRVHGSAVNTYPWGDAGMRTGNSHRVYPGNYFHGHYSNQFCHQDNLFGSRAKTWWDCRNPSSVAVEAEILPCNFDAAGQQNDGDSCKSMGRDLFIEPRWSRKDDRSQPYSAPPTPSFNVPAQVSSVNDAVAVNQLCYYSESGERGLADCIDSSSSYVGKMMNDVISSLRFGTNQANRWRLFQNNNFGGAQWTVNNTANDEVSSIRKCPADC